MKFVLTIELGNDAMSLGGDVADALRRVARILENEVSDVELGDGTGSTILDTNGNYVGAWSVADWRIP